MIYHLKFFLPLLAFQKPQSPTLIQNDGHISELKSSTSSPSVQQCNCVNLKDCKTIIELLRKQQKPLSELLIKFLRDSTCGFNNHEPLICCPKFLNNESDISSMVLVTTTEMPWIWDIENTTKKYSSEKNSEHNIQNEISTRNRFNDFDEDYHLNLIDFEDPRTLKNCPPSFYEDDNGNSFDIYKSKSDIDKNLWGWKPYIEPPFAEFPHFKPHQQRPYFHNRKPYQIITTTGKPTFRRKNTSSPLPIPPATIPTNKKNNKNLNSSRCGISVGTRIIGGIDAGPRQFPWMARLAYRNRCKYKRKKMTNLVITTMIFI